MPSCRHLPVNVNQALLISSVIVPQITTLRDGEDVTGGCQLDDTVARLAPTLRGLVKCCGH